MLGKQQVNCWTLNGKRCSPIRQNEDGTYNFIVKNYTKKSTLITVRIPENIWRPTVFDSELYFYFIGSLNSCEIEPHKFNYELLAEKIYTCTKNDVCYFSPTNEFKGYAYLSQDPVVLKDVHPYQVKLFLGNSSFLDEKTSSFLGERQFFNLTLLRKNTMQTSNLKQGDLIKFQSTVTSSEEFGTQIIGKNIVLVNPS